MDLFDIICILWFGVLFISMILLIIIWFFDINDAKTDNIEKYVICMEKINDADYCKLLVEA